MRKLTLMLSALLGAGAMMLCFAPIGAADRGAPYEVHGAHISCGTIGFDGQFAVGAEQGTYVDGALQVSLTNVHQDDSVWSADFEGASFDVEGVIVLGSIGDELVSVAWQYHPGVRADHGLVIHAFHAYHVLFCFHHHGTAVTVAGFAARHTTSGVTLTWRVASEMQALGYNVYRQVGANRVRLNHKLIMASGPHTYRWVMYSAKPGVRYWLQAVSLHETQWFGPAQA